MDSKNFYSQATESSQRPDKSSRKKNKTVSINQIKIYIVEIQELKADIKDKQNKDKSFYDAYCKKFEKWVNKFMMINQIEELEEYAVILPIIYQVIDDDLTSMNKMFYPTIIESEEICKLKIEIKERMIKELSGKVASIFINMSLHNPSLTFSDLMNLAKIYNNITEISHEISKILCDFKKNLNSKYQFGQWFSEKLENPKKNKKELINKAETLSKDFNYLTKLNRCDINFREFGGEEFINSLTEQLKELRIKLPQKMQEFFITKLNKNLDICLQIMEIFMINLDTETNTLLNFSEVYYKYKNKYGKLIRNIYDKLEDNLEKDNFKDFYWNFFRLKETDRINYASNNNAQIIERLKGYIKKAFKENKDNIDDFAMPFFQKAKKYKLIFDYIKFKCDFKIIKRLKKKNKNWIGKPNIEKWEKMVKKLPSIFNNYLLEFKYFAFDFKECKEADGGSHCIEYNRNILIAGFESQNLLQYSIDNNSFSIIDFQFEKLKRKILINAERFYLIECGGFIFESEIRDFTKWKQIGDSIIKNNYPAQIYSLVNKRDAFIGSKNPDKIYKFSLDTKIMNKV